MNANFKNFVESYNQESLKEFKNAVQLLARNLLLYYQALLEAGFDTLSALELTKGYQSHILSLSLGNKKNDKGEEE